MDDRRRDVALFRYSLIREAADLALSKAERGALVRALAARDHTGPNGERVRVARNTVDRWMNRPLFCVRSGEGSEHAESVEVFTGVLGISPFGGRVVMKLDGTAVPIRRVECS